MNALAADRVVRALGPVAVVGAGISGAACAGALADGGLRVRMYDRGEGLGGRLASYAVDGRMVDAGASYFTVSDPRFAAVAQDWERRGVARPWTDTFHVAGPEGITGTSSGPVRWACAGGLRSIAVDLLGERRVTHPYDVESVAPGPSVDGEVAEAAVLAMPDPQAADLLAPTLREELAVLEDRTWEPVLALAAGWDRRSWLPELDGVFVNDSPVLGWVADDGRRRGDGAPVLVAHSTSAFAEANIDDPAAAVAELVATVRAVLGVGEEPRWVRVHRWSLARPVEGREAPFFLGEAMVGLCGDGWHGKPRVEAAYLSGLELGQALVERLT
ncbi:NAD(P)/FAD-dependent oxidoreductase [Motilibacter deserti]|uniref:NAD(P)/FAD-dependent oxidoreductase n=1 Tax=Motilibacter deserti TaxID=2714956 RepID=UPI002F2B6746